MKNSSDTRDLPTCIAVPQPTALPGAPQDGQTKEKHIYGNREERKLKKFGK